MRSAVPGLCGYQTPDPSPQASPEPHNMSKPCGTIITQSADGSSSHYQTVRAIVKQEYNVHGTLPTPEMSPVEQANADSFNFEENGGGLHDQLRTVANPVKQLCTKFSTESGYLKDVKNPYQDRFNLPSNLSNILAMEDDEDDVALKNPLFLDQSSGYGSHYHNMVACNQMDHPVSYQHSPMEQRQGYQTGENTVIYRTTREFVDSRRSWTVEDNSPTSQSLYSSSSSVIQATPTSRQKSTLNDGELCLPDLIDPRELDRYLEPGTTIKMEPESSPSCQPAANRSTEAELADSPKYARENELIDALRETRRLIM